MMAAEKQEAEKQVDLWPITLVLVVILGALLYFYIIIGKDLAEVILAILLIIGVMALIVTLSYTTAIFQSLGLSNPKSALGLPEGSMQAVIALSLILIFLIASVLLYQQVSRGTDIKISTNLTQTEFDKIPTDKIAYFQRLINADNQTSYNVGIIIAKTQASEDIAKQLITTVSTLVVAVAGFYFGSKTVTDARSIAGKENPPVETKPPEIKPPENKPPEIKPPEIKPPENNIES